MRSNTAGLPDPKTAPGVADSAEIKEPTPRTADANATDAQAPAYALVALLVADGEDTPSESAEVLVPSTPQGLPAEEEASRDASDDKATWHKAGQPVQVRRLCCILNYKQL